jgi:hypothetical protein
MRAIQRLEQVIDRKETPAPKSGFANEREIDSGTARTLGGPTGREIEQRVGVPRSTVTREHDAGSGANETVDGLSGTEELTRQAAEDDAPGLDDVEAEADDTPGFDRAGETHL